MVIGEARALAAAAVSSSQWLGVGLRATPADDIVGVGLSSVPLRSDERPEQRARGIQELEGMGIPGSPTAASDTGYCVPRGERKGLAVP